MATGKNYNHKHAPALYFIQRQVGPDTSTDFIDEDINWTSDPTPWEESNQVPPYNCFGFVMDSQKVWDTTGIFGDIEGDPRSFWPRELEDPSPWLAAFVEEAANKGFTDCGQDSSWEQGYEKILLLHVKGVFVHAALQISADRWKSKLELLSDFEHSLKAILMTYPGHRTTFMRRARSSRTLK